MNLLAQTPKPSLPAQIFDTLKEVLGSVLDSTQQLIAENAGDFLLGLLTLLVGWIVASLLRGILSKVARALGVDVVADRSGLLAFMRKNDIQQPPSRYLGWGVYALLLYATTLAGFDRMGLGALADFLRHLASYIPRACVVILLLALGVGMGRIVAGLTTRAARISGLPVPQVLGSCSRIAVEIFAFFLALNYLQWASPSVLFVGFALVMGVALGTAVLFTIAARGLTESLLNHPFIKATYKKGDRIQFEETEGVIEKLDAAATHIRTEKGLILVPNRVLASQTVTKL